MLDTQKLGTKLSLGFGLLLFIASLLGLAAIISMERIRGESDSLAHQHIPGWDLAGDILNLQYQTGYRIGAYSFNHDDDWLSNGRTLLGELAVLLERSAKAADGDANQRHLLPMLSEIRKALDAYGTSIDKTVGNVRRIKSARRDIERQGETFGAAIAAYRQSQYESMSKQIKAKDTAEELQIRLERIASATQILDLSHETLIGTWTAEANRDMETLSHTAKNAGKLLGMIDTLIGTTRQQVNLDRLAIVRESVLKYRRTVSELVAAAQEENLIRSERFKAYDAVLERANAFIDDTKQTALGGANQTTKDVALAKGVLIVGLSIALLIGIAIAFLITRDTLRQLGGEPALAVAIVQRVATGDLSQDIPLRPGDGASLLAAVASMQSSLRTLMQNVSAGSSQLAAAAEQLSATAEETRHQVRRQQAETELVATAMNEMTATVEEVARHAAGAAGAARDTDQAADIGSRVVTETIEAINVLAHDVESAGQVIARLSDDSQEIGAVLDVIRGVAEQTNLLALNAAIEAARAGEQGRGFAVVASEVRTLASRTQASIQDIHEKIERVQGGSTGAVRAIERGREKAMRGVEQARLAGDSLRTIATAVSSINDMNTQIASAAEEQSAVAEEINRNLHGITEAVEQTAAGSNQIAAASEELARLAVTLQEGIGQFRL